MTRNIYFILVFAFFALFQLPAAAQRKPGPAPKAQAPAKPVLLGLTAEKGQDLRLSPQGGGAWQVETTGSDPYLFTEQLGADIPAGHHILTFEYFCTSWLDHLQIFFGPPVDENKSIHTELGVAEGWKTFSIDVKEQRAGWGKKGDFLRLDFGSAPNYRMQIRNIHFRKPTARELEIAARREKEKQQDVKLAEKLKTYLTRQYPHQVSRVAVGPDKITVQGRLRAAGQNLLLAEVPLYQDITELDTYDHTWKIPARGQDFTLSIDRYVDAGDKKVDRLFSKWAIVEQAAGKYRLASHARYADTVAAQYDLPEEKPRNKKGIGGFHAGGNAPVSDLDSLDISSVTINIWITKFIRSKPAADTEPFRFNGKTYYVDRQALAGLDRTLQLTASKNIIASAIILVGKASDVQDKEIGRIFEHPSCDPAGIYSMANMSSAQGLEYYAAIIDFLARRYSRPDKKYGRLHHWIMHNEVDAGWVWTNMGEKPALLFMDEYHKSMRTVYNIARKYNRHAKVFVSLTHYWNWTSDRHYYLPKELLDIMVLYSKAEGDFEWAIAQHPYPESLFEPKSWLDRKVDFTFDTPLITYKNIEVLDAWVKQPHTWYLGKHRRTIHLSEQGTNSMDYTQKSLLEQAAGMAYAWKKIKDLETIEAFQYHNWMDHRGEGGLRIGLRRFPDDKEMPMGKKPIWNVFRDMGTAREEAAFEFAKKIIGIQDWEEVQYKGQIRQPGKKQSYRDLKSDTWQATDALGRALPGFDQAGPVKAGRYVGMFYFLTHNSAGKPGPSDVSKIKAANPDQPAWGEGTHYWGEPEAGYYLSTDEWVIRQHARLLADAGVDVIIFDCTNNLTYPEVTATIFKVFRQMRQEGEATPDIAYLASEQSVHQVWDQIYSKGLYADLWFHWKGKPLLLFGQWAGIKPMPQVQFPSHIQQFFSLRSSWAWTTLPWYRNQGQDMWPWVDHYPQHIGWHESRDKAEYVPVAVAQHPLSNIGRSFRAGQQPATDRYDLTPVTGQGLHFEEQWQRALEVDPEFVFVTGWNEWTAGRMVMRPDVDKALQEWDFYPGAKLGKVGKPLKPGEVYFIDQYNQEYSRDIEPMKGGHADNYYYQLMANIRRYKGVRAPETASPATIDIRGSFAQWQQAGVAYYDHLHDTLHRQAPGNFQAGPYSDASGRNDIAGAKVVHDRDHVYFCLETASDLTSFRDKNWMLVFIDADQDPKTGWKGYDYVVNSRVLGATTTTLRQLRPNGKPGRQQKLAMQIAGNKVMIRVPRASIGQQQQVKLAFHVADNAPGPAGAGEFFLHGDHAPSRRANYQYGEGGSERVKADQ